MNEYKTSMIIKELANNNDAAHMICLYLYMNNCADILEDLQKLGIKGRHLEIFVYECCIDTDLIYIRQAVDFLKSGVLSKEEIEKNLKSARPFNFLPDLLNEELDTETQYKTFAEELRTKLGIRKR